VQNNAAEEQTAQQVQEIYGRVQRQVYWFLAATLAAILATGLYLIHSNRRLFAQLAALSDERRELARMLIATRESTLREISRELHDELGQILTAIGSMLGRAGKQAPEGSALRADLREIREVAQTALDSVRGLSQTLHPSILEDLGLESTVDWYLSTVEKQLGIAVTYERAGTAVPIDATIGIHVYRVLQEALNNVARHSGADRAIVRLRVQPGTVALEVEDHGRGLPADVARSGPPPPRGFAPKPSGEGGPAPAARGLGLVAMRERAELVNGSLEFLTPPGGGTLVRLKVPLSAGAQTAALRTSTA
jgi:signal transduction histidine kinase